MTIPKQVQNDYKRWYHFLEQEVQFSLSFDTRVYLVMAFHDRDDVLGEAALTEQKSGILLYHIFKDADALDRFRLGPNGLDIRYLRTAEGKSLYRYAEQFERGDANA